VVYVLVVKLQNGLEVFNTYVSIILHLLKISHDNFTYCLVVHVRSAHNTRKYASNSWYTHIKCR